MSVTNRIIYSNNGVLTDISKQVLNYQTGTYAVASFVAAEDYIYFGSIAPFNHFYLKLSAVSAVASNTMTIQYWDGQNWIDSSETIDDTAGLTTSGYVTFVPSRNNAWLAESTNDRGESVTGLTTKVIYNLFWARIKLSTDVPLGFTLSWAGQKFSDDNDLGSEFPDLVRASMLASFGATKTDWEEQHVKAAEIMVQDLISAAILDFKDEILVREEFILASVMKVAQIIFRGLGDDYKDQMTDSQAEYLKRLDKSVFRSDKNSNAMLDKQEIKSRTGFMTR